MKKYQEKQKTKKYRNNTSNISRRESIDRCKICTDKMFTKELQEKGEKSYQYTAIDEFTRIIYTWFTNEHSTHMSSEFIKRAIKYFKFKIETVQTDNRIYK